VSTPAAALNSSESTSLARVWLGPRPAGRLGGARAARGRAYERWPPRARRNGEGTARRGFGWSGWGATDHRRGLRRL